VRYLTAVRDPYGNRISVTYVEQPDTYLVSLVTQYVGGGHFREVQFVYESDPFHSVQSITWSGRTWTYLYTSGSAGQLLLSQAVPPIGPAWTFGYTNDELTSVTTPQGGVIGYEYGPHTFGYPEHYGPRGEYSTGGVKVSRVVSARTVGGRGIVGGRW